MTTSAASAGLQAARSTAMAVLRSPWPWIVLAIIAAAILHRNGKRWWYNLTRLDRGNYEGHQLNAADRARVEGIARELHRGINSWTNAGRTQAISRALALNDTELKYLADFYASINAGGTLLTVLDNEWTLPDAGQELIARLIQIGARKSKGDDGLNGSFTMTEKTQSPTT